MASNSRPKPKSVGLSFAVKALKDVNDNGGDFLLKGYRSEQEMSGLRQKYKLGTPTASEQEEIGRVGNKVGFIPQSMLKNLIGRATAYAISKGDYFAGITFLCEGVFPKAFYYDPASGSKGKGTLINTHPGITLKYQKAGEIRQMFANTSIGHMKDEIVSTVQAGTRMTANMDKARLSASDFYNMFDIIRDKYSKGADDALISRFKSHPLAVQKLNSGMSSRQLLTEIKKELPVTSFSVLQQLSYKYGQAGIKKFGKLLDATISAALDPERQDMHLQNGARHIVYQYRNGSNQWIQDTRVMNIHRLFYVAGVKFSPEMNLKLSMGHPLSSEELKIAQDVAKKAGVPSVIKGGRLDLPDGTKDTAKGSSPYVLNDKAINQGVKEVNQNFKPVSAEPPKPTPAPTINTQALPKPKPPKPKTPSMGMGGLGGF